jgi:hypothetical protein
VTAPRGRHGVVSQTWAVLPAPVRSARASAARHRRSHRSDSSRWRHSSHRVSRRAGLHRRKLHDAQLPPHAFPPRLRRRQHLRHRRVLHELRRQDRRSSRTHPHQRLRARLRSGHLYLDAGDRRLPRDRPLRGWATVLHARPAGPLPVARAAFGRLRTRARVNAQPCRAPDSRRVARPEHLRAGRHRAASGPPAEPKNHPSPCRRHRSRRSEPLSHDGSSRAPNRSDTNPAGAPEAMRALARVAKRSAARTRCQGRLVNA